MNWYILSLRIAMLKKIHCFLQFLKFIYLIIKNLSVFEDGSVSSMPYLAKQSLSYWLWPVANYLQLLSWLLFNSESCLLLLTNCFFCRDLQCPRNHKKKLWSLTFMANLSSSSMIVLCLVLDLLPRRLVNWVFRL